MPIGLTQSLHRAVQQRGRHTATVMGERRQTYAQLADRVARLGCALRGFGVGKGDRVAIWALNSDHWMESLLAIWWVGAAVNPVNTRWAPAEVAFSLVDCDTGVLLVDDEFAPRLAQVQEQVPGLKQVIFIGEGECPAGAHRLQTLIDQHPPCEDARATGDDLAAVFYTGGTTGHPKGVMLSHTAFSGAVMTRRSVEVPMGPVYLHTAPMFHMVGVLGVLWQLSHAGIHVVLPAFAPLAFMQAVQRERVSDTGMVPTMIQMVLDHPQFSGHDLSSLRCVIYGAAPISEALLERTVEKLPQLQLLQAYGMTELAGPVTLLTPRYHSREARSLGKLSSAGCATVASEVSIVDGEGRPCPPGTPGEIRVAGMNTMLGYWNRPEETEHALRDGWVYTGDIGWMDQDGFVFIVDRMKDMIVSGGENVYSAEVENALARHPAVATCAVIGIPSEQWGESVHAAVVLREGMSVSHDALIDHCRTLIAGYKCPRSFEILPQLPLSAAGKVLKHRLREPHWAGHRRGVN